MRIAVSLTGLVLVVVCATAHAEPTPVLESWVEDRPDDADRLLAPFESASAFTQGPALAATIEDQLSQPGAADRDATAQAMALADRGYESWLEGEFTEATESLQKALDLMHASPALFATRADERPLLYKTLVGLAGAHQRLGQTDRAVAVMAELVRSFPDTPFNRALFPPDVFELYRRVKQDLDDQRAGTLRVRVNDDSVSIFLNERFVGTGASYQAELPPGRYRIYTQKGSRAGRLHHVEVAGGVETSAEIDWYLDSALRTGPGTVGLLFADAPERAEHEVVNALAVGRALGSDSVIVVGTRDFEGRHSLVGTVLSVDTGKVIRTAAVALEPATPGPDAFADLARFLAGGEPTPELLLPGRRPAGGTVPVTRRDDRGRSFGAWKWAALGTGVAALATGVVFIQLDGPILDDQGNHTPDQYETRGPGIGLVAGGAALIGTGLVLWLLERPADRPATSAAVVPTAGGLTFAIGGSF